MSFSSFYLNFFLYLLPFSVSFSLSDVYALYSRVILNWSLSAFIPQGQAFKFPMIISVCVCTVRVCLYVCVRERETGAMSASIIQRIAVLLCVAPKCL